MQKDFFSLKKHNTFGLDVKTRCFFEFSNLQELQHFCKNTVVQQPIFILGGGSNVLFTKDFPGTVIHPRNTGIQIVKETETQVFVSVAAGEIWDDFVQWAVSHNYYGVENLSIIPGHVGASAIQNIGAYGVEAKDVIHTVQTINLQTGELRTFSNAECLFDYRKSVFKSPDFQLFCVYEVTFVLSKIPRYTCNYGALSHELKTTPHLSLELVRNTVIRIRELKLPDYTKIGNAGSFFKNPVIPLEQFKILQKSFPHIVHYPASENHVKIAAAWLIENLGCKQFQYGDARVYEKQALVLINAGNARAQDILSLAQKIQNHVHKASGIMLEPEVIYV
ncbi:MAG: UDP-N-acetylmuramate dehydrogenase [Bacteroidales bacterium]|jgi:UDP-N-acetylmuramate dehydrogenase|nr:UDP-N-acetylmuramate dehydrogenase [Bacteroidales bacterium]NLK81841.1 UDP-N-acetylmuramate dehydrogenase [Bacteroidales bacterium]